MSEYKDGRGDYYLAAGKREERSAGAAPAEALQALSAAYYAIPAGEPSTDQVIERLPDLYRAVEGVLAAGETISGLLGTVSAARESGYPIHAATRTTCAEHIAEGDDQKTKFAFPSEHA